MGIINSKLDRERKKVASLEDRVKELESFVEKVYHQSWSKPLIEEAADLLGLSKDGYGAKAQEGE